MKRREFTVLIERDEDNILIATVPALKGCHTQANYTSIIEKNKRSHSFMPGGRRTI